MRKLLSLALCMVMLLGLAMPALAEDTVTEHSCTYDEGHVTTAATCTTEGVMTYTCIDCGNTVTETISALGHSWDNGTVNVAATCTTDGKTIYTCTDCNATEEKTVLATGHNYTEWHIDEEQGTHERSCTNSGCTYWEYGYHEWDGGKIINAATCDEPGSRLFTCKVCEEEIVEIIPALTEHTYDNKCDPDCNVCGAERTVSHTYTTAWSSDYNTHWHECTKCGDKKDVARHTAGPAATEDDPQTCTVCDYIITPKKEHTHKYETDWTSDEVGHWHACSGCTSEKDYASHTYDDDCDAECNVCRYKRDADHTYEEDGWFGDNVEHWRICVLCEEESEHEEHIPGEEATDENPQLCTACGYELVPIQEHVHDFGEEWLLTDEVHWQECKCGGSSVAASHTWDEGVENRKGDTITYTCTVCGAQRYEEAPSSGFPWIIVFILLALVCVGGIVAIVIILKRGEFDEVEDDDEE